MRAVLYDDGRYRVSAQAIATPTRPFPMMNASVSVRRDPLWASAALCALSVACLAVYGDLLYPREEAMLIGTAIAAILVGANLRILRIEAPGHRRTFIVGSSRRLMKLFRAILDAQSFSRISSSSIVITDDFHPDE